MLDFKLYLQEHDIKYVGVYGSLRKGHGNWAWSFARDPEKVLKVQGFKMFGLFGDSFPCIVEDEGEIVVELYAVSTVDVHTLYEIDDMEQGAGYKRIIKEVDGEKFVLYYYDKDDEKTKECLEVHTTGQIEKGDWTEYLQK